MFSSPIPDVELAAHANRRNGKEIWSICLTGFWTPDFLWEVQNANDSIAYLAPCHSVAIMERVRLIYMTLVKYLTKVPGAWVSSWLK